MRGLKKSGGKGKEENKPAAKKSTPAAKKSVSAKSSVEEPKKSAVQGFDEEPDNDELDDLLSDDDIVDDEPEVANEESEEGEVLDDDLADLEEAEEYVPPSAPPDKTPIKPATELSVVKSKDSGFSKGTPIQIWVSCTAKVTTKQYENVDVGTGITLTLPEGSTKEDAEEAREEAWNYCQEFVDELVTDIRKKSKEAQRRGV